MAWKQILVFMVSLMFHKTASQQCGVDTYSIYQTMLKGHTFKTFKVRPGSHDCRHACNSDVRCQSYNYVIFKHICELNNRTKEARPEDFVKNSDRYYMMKALKRVPLASIPELPADSCKEIKASEGGQAVSGNYWLDSTRSGNSILAFCDMNTGADVKSSCKEVYDVDKSNVTRLVTLHIDSKLISVLRHMGDFGCGDGGWTPVMKIDGNNSTFNYNSGYWSNETEYNLAGGETGFDTQETKLPTYWNTPFSKICLGMKIDEQIKFIVINKTANSLYSLIADGQYHNTSLGRDTWKSLIGSQASLQRNCNKEGFNAVCRKNGASKARIGFLGDNDKGCFTCDSRIGFGTGGFPDDSNTCGNEAPHKHIKAMGYILVQ